MDYIKTEIDGVWIIQPKVYNDARGYFFEAWKKEEFEQHVGRVDFIQDNESKSSRGVLRGLHFQKNHTQGKLVRVTKGEVFDVAVDLRKESATYGRYVAVTLSADNNRQLYIPRGFAHGFLVLSETAEFAYKCDDFYHPEDEGGICWNDPTIAVQWPEVPSLVLSEKDKKHPTLKECRMEFAL